MKKSTKNWKILTPLLLASIVSLGSAIHFGLLATGHASFLAAVFGVESTTPETIKSRYTNVSLRGEKLRILVVPGHDSDYPGTSYLNLSEANLNLALAKELSTMLSSDPRLDVILARDDAGYNPQIINYINYNSEQINLSATSKKLETISRMAGGQVVRNEKNVYHNSAAPGMVTRLYGINMWANENRIDLVINIHFNDYPRKRRSEPGKYSGYVIYVPDHQYSNARASKSLANSISDKLAKFFAESDLPKESGGVVEDQDLVALGAFNTLDPASILIEYGYIYEPQFVYKSVRPTVLKELASATYAGVIEFLMGNKYTQGIYDTTLLPYSFVQEIEKEDRGVEVLHLQAALAHAGYYPPDGLNKNDCPLSGYMGPCTRKSLSSFQKDNKITDEKDRVGTKTLEVLNTLYSY